MDDPNVVSVRRYAVPPGWATPVHQHSGHMFLYIVEGSGGLKFILFQVGPEGPPLTVPAK